MHSASSVNFGFLVFPFGLFGTVVLIIVLVILGNAFSKSKNVGRTLLSMVAAALILLILLSVFGVFTGMFWANRSESIRHEVAVAQAEAQAQVQAAKDRVEAVKQDILVKEAEVQARIESIDSPGKRILYEDPQTQAATEVDVVEVQQADTHAGAVAKAEKGRELIPTPAETPAAPSISETGKPAADSHKGITVAGTPWSDAVEVHQDFEADVYPSIESAAEALGRNVGRDLMEHVPSAQPENTTPVYVWLESDDQTPSAGGDVLLVTRPVLEALAQGIRQKLLNPDVVSVERPTVQSSADQHVTVVRVQVSDQAFEHHNRWRQQTESGSGFLVATVDTPDFDFSRNMRFEQAPWVADASRFASQYRNGQWLIAYSDVTHTNQTFAHSKAISAAAEALLPQAEARIAQMSPSQQQRYEQKRASSPDWLRKRVADELVSRNHMTDTFTQRYDRPNYTVWREAVLIDATPGMIDRITDALVGSLNADVTRQRITWASYIGLAGLIFGTYVFLNMATKGYYAWMLRLAAIAGVGGVILLIRIIG